MTDGAFENATDVTSIRYRLHPLDVGFDLRRAGHVVEIGDEPQLRVSYPAEDGERRVIDGPRQLVVARLRKLGFTIRLVGGAS
jgi:hypothetical protein